MKVGMRHVYYTTLLHRPIPFHGLGLMNFVLWIYILTKCDAFTSVKLVLAWWGINAFVGTIWQSIWVKAKEYLLLASNQFYFSTYFCAFEYVGRDKNFWTIPWFAASIPSQPLIPPIKTLQNVILSKGERLILKQLILGY